MTKRSLRNTVATIGCATLALAGLTAAPADAAPGDVQINELLYHAADADLTYGALEFVELRNTGSEPVDVGGWQFTAGITGTAIPAGVTIPAGGYLVGTNDAASGALNPTKVEAKAEAPENGAPADLAIENAMAGRTCRFMARRQSNFCKPELT